MNPKFLKFLCCPNTKLSLSVKIFEIFKNGNIKSGKLINSNNTFSYPIINGIPRFVNSQEYLSNFGFEWRKWSRIQFDSSNVGKIMQNHTNEMFSKITEFEESNIKGKYILEFGCGSGRFMDVVLKKGGFAIGIDMSSSVEIAYKNLQKNNNFLIVQGDILSPPFKKGVFDAAYSIGVLHHTPDPIKGFKNMANCIKKNGKIACCVYPKKGLYNFPSVKFYRKFFNINNFFNKKLALIYSYFSSYFLYYILWIPNKIPLLKKLIHLLEKYLIVNVKIPDRKWRLLDTYDAITPYYASTHTSAEIIKWFRTAGCVNVKNTQWDDTSFAGIRN